MARQLSAWMQTIDDDTATRYTKYWNSLKPKDDKSLFKIWLFSFMSVHTTWQNNVNGFNELRDLSWLGSKRALLTRLERSGVGLHNNRTRYVWQFRKDFWKNPDDYRKTRRESWTNFRNRLATKTLGLGLAKTTFALEMAYPEAPLCCLDRHILRFMYGDTKLNGNMSPNMYANTEARWVRAARKQGVHAPMARHIYWDGLQGQSDTRYWSSCLES